MKDLFEFEKFATVDVVDTYLEEQVSQLIKGKANGKATSEASTKVSEPSSKGTGFDLTPKEATGTKKIYSMEDTQY